MASIREVAKIAGVSPATVSRVMNGTANVDEEKKQRVLEAIQETGFKPNELARALFKKSSKIIGMIVPNIENPFFSEIAKAVEEEAFQNGYKMLLCNSANNPKKERMNIQMLVQMQADGIVFMTNSDRTGKKIAECGLPVVVMDRKLSEGREIAFIESDHYKGGKLAAEHLIECGCQHIVCLRGPMKFSSGQQRYQGYEDVCRKYGRKAVWIDCDYDYDAGLAAAEELIRRYPDTDGILASNDMAAMAVYKVLHQNGRRVPEDVQLVGFDNIEFSRRMTPELTTISQPIEEMGKLAVQMIIHHGEEISYQKENIFDVELIRRQTTKKKGEAE